MHEKIIGAGVANLFIERMKLEGWLPIKEYFKMKKLGIELDWAEKEIFKDLIHNANEVPQIGRGRILAYSRDCGYRNLYNLYDMMYKTDCGTYQEMWELEVKAYYLDGWIYADELFDLIIKGGDSK